jgi:hypothetical protein
MLFSFRNLEGCIAVLVTLAKSINFPKIEKIDNFGGALCLKSNVKEILIIFFYG